METHVSVRDRFNQPDQRPASRRATLGVTLLCALTLVALARPAAAQERTATKPKATAPATAGPTSPAASVSSSEIVCDSIAAPAAPRKVVAARPRKAVKRKPVIAGAVAAAPKPRPTRTVAVAPARKRRPSPGSAAGHRAAKPVAARATTPPRCHSAVAVAATPDVGAVQNLVSSLPWTAPAPDVTFPVASAPTLAELGGMGLRTGGTLAAGLLGAGAFWLKSGSSEEGRSVVPDTTGGTGTPLTPGGGPDVPGGPNGPPPITTVPEPATLALVASGLAAIGARTRRRRTR